MIFVVLVMLGIATWFYIAPLIQYQGYVWAERTCTSLPAFCDSPNAVAIGSIVIIVFFMIARTVRN
jgi:hypothetical protein